MTEKHVPQEAGGFQNYELFSQLTETAEASEPMDATVSYIHHAAQRSFDAHKDHTFPSQDAINDTLCTISEHIDTELSEHGLLTIGDRIVAYQREKDHTISAVRRDGATVSYFETVLNDNSRIEGIYGGLIVDESFVTTELHEFFDETDENNDARYTLSPLVPSLCLLYGAKINCTEEVRLLDAPYVLFIPLTQHRPYLKRIVTSSTEPSAA